jgi:hypothetical protein
MGRTGAPFAGIEKIKLIIDFKTPRGVISIGHRFCARAGSQKVNFHNYSPLFTLWSNYNTQKVDFQAKSNNL